MLSTISYLPSILKHFLIGSWFIVTANVAFLICSFLLNCLYLFLKRTLSVGYNLSRHMLLGTLMLREPDMCSLRFCYTTYVCYDNIWLYICPYICCGVRFVSICPYICCQNLGTSQHMSLHMLSGTKVLATYVAVWPDGSSKGICGCLGD